MKKYISVAIGVLIVSCVFSPKKQTTMNELLPNDWAELQTQTSGSIILDVRTEEEFESGYIAGAKNLDIRGGADFISSIEELDKSKAYFVYCRSGARSGQACQLMEQMGFEQVYNLEGGVLAWEGDLEE
ncbi:MAG: Thiosulfate sulfurtransferase PspE [Flavobacteriales bacterium]|nr:MAG: Thiosulfate sulfurtransferase PspE [Flavobacteriales bacterium]